MVEKGRRSEPQPLLTTKDVAAQLAVEVRWVQENKHLLPPCIHVGRQLRWRQEDLELWIVNHKGRGSETVR